MNKKSLSTALSVLTLAGLALAAYRYLDAKALTEAWNSFSWDVWGLLLILPALYLALKAFRFVELMKPVSKAEAADVGLGYAASQAASLLPGGVAMRAAMMARIGVPPEESSGPVLANSFSDQLILLGAGLYLCYYYPQLRPTAIGLTLLLVVTLLALWQPSSRKFLAGTLKNLAQRLGQGERIERFYQQLAKLKDAGLWARVLGYSLLANAVSLIILVTVTGALGFRVQPWPLAAAFVVPGLLGRLSPLPAGAGVTEAGMVGFLATQTSMNFNEAAVATLIFRMADVILPALYGFLCYGLFQVRVDTPTDTAARAA